MRSRADPIRSAKSTKILRALSFQRTVAASLLSPAAATNFRVKANSLLLNEATGADA
jgi:hypothetical protein